MKVLFLDAYYEPEQIAFTHLENDLIEGLIEHGHTVHIVCPIPTRGIDKNTVEKYKGIRHQSKNQGKVKVTRFWAPQEGKNPVTRALRYFWCNLRTYQLGIRATKVDVVFANSTPPTQGWIAGKVAKKLNAPFVYSLQDIFPDSLINAQMTKKGSLIWRIGRIIENYTYKSASKIIVLSKSFKNNIIEKGVSETKIVVIPNWIDTCSVYPIDRKDNVLFDRYNLDQNKFYICYSGNIGHSQNLGLLYKCAIRLQKETPDICFLLIGEGAAKEKFEQKIKEKGLTNIIVLPFQPYEDIAHVFSLGDVGLIISKPGIGNSSVPSKTWSIMAAKKPILASFDEESELSRLIIAEKCGLCSNPKSVDNFIEKLLCLKNHNTMAKQMGNNGFDYVREFLSKDNCVSKYIKVLKETI